MTSFIKSTGITLISIGLLGLGSGCGKNLMPDSSGLDQKVAKGSLEPVALTEKTSGIQPLAGLDEIHLSRKIEPDVGKSPRGSQANHQSPSPQGGPDSSLGDASVALNNDLGSQAVLKTSSEESSVVSGQGSDRKGVTFSNGLQDIYFQFDSWRLTDKSRRVLESNAEWLKAYPHEHITIEGHCDERGTQAYNYVLGEKRAAMVQQYLRFLGVPHQQLVVMSFGKDKPKCHIYSENCFQKNRRAHFGSDLNLASRQ